ncbi:deoxyribonuclease IV [Paenibacillus thailandensis]|uniref:Deoxyribonuclease IV n=1 Tax=Paenibacillus thailandensis TaxID=393250 RepID=A0ABW5QTL2_9BACL
MRPFGYHVSIRGGYAQAAQAAAAAGLTAFQYFPKNPRSLAIKSFDKRDAAKCGAICKELGLVSVAHTPYPTNLASSDKDRRDRVVPSLLNDLDIAEHCGSVGVVVHFGVYKGPDPLDGYKRIIACLNSVTEQWDGKAKLLIEIQSGEHTFMGTTIEELAQIRRLCDDPGKLSFCLDTCHMFASGLWQGDTGAAWLDKAKSLGVLERVAVIHYNDSLFPCGQKRDRHAEIGKGHIGESGLKWLLSVPELRHVPFILETPPGRDGTYGEQLTFMRRWGD